MDTRILLDLAGLAFSAFGVVGVTQLVKRIPWLETRGLGSPIASLVALAFYGAAWFWAGAAKADLPMFALAALAAANLATTGNTIAERVGGKLGRGEAP